MALFGNIGGLLQAGLGLAGTIAPGGWGAGATFGSQLIGAGLVAPRYGPPMVQAPPPVPLAQPMPAMGLAPLVVTGAKTLAQRFPRLYTWLNTLRQKGIDMSLEKARGLLRRWGPEAIVAAGIMTVAEVTDLTIANATIKRRRMNPGNIKALRRSMRRVKSFHRLCQHADLIRGRARRRIKCDP